LEIANDGPFTICLSEDGTVVDDDDVLVEYKDKVMLLMKSSEVYSCTDTSTALYTQSSKQSSSNEYQISGDGEIRLPVSSSIAVDQSEYTCKLMCCLVHTVLSVL